jgi:hypothetical protein
MGRRAKLEDVILLPDGKGGSTPRIRWEVIVERVRAGAYPETAATSTGIGKTTFYNWRIFGEDRIVDGKVVRARPGYREFREALTRAEAEAEMLHVAHITKAAPEDWKAAAWYLERRAPERWRRRDSLWHGGPGEGDAPLVLELDGKVDLGGDALDKLGDVLEVLADSGALDRPSEPEGAG